MAKKTPKAEAEEERRDTHARGGDAEEYPHGRISVRDAKEEQSPDPRGL